MASRCFLPLPLGVLYPHNEMKDFNFSMEEQEKCNVKALKKKRGGLLAVYICVCVYINIYMCIYIFKERGKKAMNSPDYM